MERDERKKVLELLLWMTDRPLKATEIVHILGDSSFTELELREDLNILGREFDDRQAPYHVVEVAHGFQLASRPAFSQWVRKLYKEKTALRLSPSALETLSIVAYKQPLTRGEIEDIRGVDVSGTLETLLERKLVKIVGRKEALGRPLLYGSTTDFMKQFGLRSLDELPRLEELVPSDDSVPTEPLATEPPLETLSETDIPPEGVAEVPVAETLETPVEEPRA
ncbi:MAG: SMC-Scp complex subunit ScpB [Elusimicrobia bacterium]|jgi:segregation and condensation protein B|nr:SMC-Scp complex subunit ScpB [Elusimicrobiota bacterium]